MDSEYETLNVHTEVCWPTNDKFEMAVFQRRKKLLFLNSETEKILAIYFSDVPWL